MSSFFPYERDDLIQYINLGYGAKVPKSYSIVHLFVILCFFFYQQGPDFDDMSSFFPCEIDDAIQYINLGYGAQAPKVVIL